jgi:predicted acetyltransferase
MANIPDGFESVDLTPDHQRAVLELDQWAFPATESIEDLLALPSPLDWQRTHALVPSGAPEQLAGMHSSYAFGHTPVPGGELAVAGLTWVGVHPQWRRRGLLRAIIAQHFDNCQRRGEPISMLFAAEPAIYGRFGYGLCSRQLTLTIPRGAALRPAAGSDDVSVLVQTRTRDHAELIGRLHAGVRRPGWVTRESPELIATFFEDPQVFREGREAARIMVAERNGEPVGYALFRRKPDWKATGPDGTVIVSESVAPDAAVAHALWSKLLDLDLTNRVEARMLAVDDPLLSLLVDLRIAAPQLQDNTWLRIIDLPAALAGRQYAAELDVVIEVTDDLISANAGRWRLQADAFAPAQVARCETDPDLAIDIRDLGSAYLGGVTMAELAAAGLVQERTAGSLYRASTAFGWPVAPVASWVF